MRRLVTLFLNVSIYLMAWGQPGNDHCSNALPIPLEPPPACREDGVFSTTISGTSEDATASTPYVLLSDYFGNGGAVSAPVSDVWYGLFPQGSRLDIQLEGALPGPVLALFQADNCDNKIPVALSRGNGKLEADVEPGQRYLLMVGSGSLAGQGTFTLSVQSYNDCSTCGQRRGFLQAFPPPENGRYEAGQTVQFCYTVPLWDPGNALEWLHSIQVTFGPGWDLSTLQATPPDACSAPAGQWAWYDSWEGCMTGEAFGPGFAYDSPLGLLCPGSGALDGNPGNNFGDGPCSSFFAAPLPLQFCWTATVGNNFSTADESNLNLDISLLADGNSGSWMPFSCPPVPSTHFLATAVPQASLMPSIGIIQAPCGNSCDGVITLSGSLNSSWSYSLLNESGNIAFSTNAQSGSSTVAGFCPGQYRLNIINDSLGITQSLSLELAPRPFPAFQLEYLPSCIDGVPGQIITSSDGSFQYPIAYFWLGPDNYTSNDASPEAPLPGTYTMYTFADNCQGAPQEIDIPQSIPEISCESGSTFTTFHWAPLPYDTAYEVAVLSGQSGAWLSPTAYRVDGLAPGETASIALSAYGTGICAVAYTEASCEAWPCQPSAISSDTVICPGGSAQLWASATPGASISWSPAASLSCADCATPTAQPAATTTYTAVITDTLGCISVQEATVAVSSLPPDVLPDEPMLFCPGQAFTICLPSENSYLWASPFGFITTGSCLKFVNPTPNIAGLYRIRVRLPGGCQFIETLQLQLDEDCPPPGGDSNQLIQPWPIAAHSTTGNLSVFPNPASTALQARLPDGGLKKLALLSAEGRLLFLLQTEEQAVEIPVGHLPPGAYLLQVVTAAGVESLPVAIVR